jgi:hypothetical protein
MFCAMEPLKLASLKNPESRPFVDAWLRWRGDQLVPSRTKLDIAQIKRELAMVSLIEVKSPEDVRVRVAGSGLTPLRGFDPTGLNLFDLTPKADWPVRWYRLRSIIEHPCGGVLMNELRRGGTLLHSVAMLALPLLPAEPGGDPQVLMLTVRTDDNGAIPMGPRPAVLPIPDVFSFVDIGAGTPGSTLPTPDASPSPARRG